jgi:hypothetical protein
MRARVSVSDTTTPLVGWDKQALSPSEVPDNPALRRLITLWSACVGGWIFFTLGLPALAFLFPSEQASFAPKPETGPVRFNPSLAELLLPGELVTLPVRVGTDPEGHPSFYAHATYKGSVPDKDHLPLHPAIGDMYSVGNLCWLWMVPNGANAPTWVDP